MGYGKELRTNNAEESDGPLPVLAGAARLRGVSSGGSGVPIKKANDKTQKRQDAPTWSEVYLSLGNELARSCAFGFLRRLGFSRSDFGLGYTSRGRLRSRWVLALCAMADALTYTEDNGTLTDRQREAIRGTRRRLELFLWP